MPNKKVILNSSTAVQFRSEYDFGISTTIGIKCVYSYPNWLAPSVEWY